MSLVFANNNRVYVRNNSEVYAARSTFIYPGSSVFAPTSMQITFTNRGNTLSDVRIWDATNEVVIAEVTNLDANVERVFQIEDMGTVSNLSAGQAVWELQLRVTNDGSNRETWVSSLLMQ